MVVYSWYTTNIYMTKLKNSYRLARLSLSIIKNDYRLILVQIYGLLATLLFVAVAWLTLSFYGLTEVLLDDSVPYSTPTVIVFAIIFYFLSSAIYYLTEAFSISLALGQIRNARISLGDASKKVTKNLGGLIQFTGISSTIGVILKALEERLPWFGDLATYITQGAWNIASAFAVPHLVDNEAQNGIAATKLSVKTFTAAFGENLIIRGGAGAFISLVTLVWLALVVITLPIILMLAGSEILALISFGLGLLGLAMIILLGMAINSVLTALLYEYAKKGNDLDLIDKELFKSMLTPTKARSVFSN